MKFNSNLFFLFRLFLVVLLGWNVIEGIMEDDTTMTVGSALCTIYVVKYPEDKDE